MYMAAARGERDRRIKAKDLDLLLDVCNSITTVVPEDLEHPVPYCEANPARLDHPACKGFKLHGICSHVVAVNHILMKYNVCRQLKTIGKSAARMGAHGNFMRPAPALQHAPEREPTSSDEEDERLEALGAQGM